MSLCTMSWMRVALVVSACWLVGCVQVPRADEPIAAAEYLRAAAVDLGELNDDEIRVAPIGIRVRGDTFIVDVMLEGAIVPVFSEGMALQLKMRRRPNDYFEIRYPNGDQVRLSPFPLSPDSYSSGVHGYAVSVGDDQARVLVQGRGVRPFLSVVPPGRYSVRLLEGAAFKAYPEQPLRMIVDTDWHEFEIAHALVAPYSPPADDPLRLTPGAPYRKLEPDEPD